MLTLKCPVCEERGITAGHKMFAPVWWKIVCKSCGVKLKYHQATMVVWGIVSYPLDIAAFIGAYVALEYIGILGAMIVIASWFAVPLLLPFRKVDS